MRRHRVHLVSRPSISITYSIDHFNRSITHFQSHPDHVNLNLNHQRFPCLQLWGRMGKERKTQWCHGIIKTCSIWGKMVGGNSWNLRKHRPVANNTDTNTYLKSSAVQQHADRRAIGHEEHEAGVSNRLVRKQLRPDLSRFAMWILFRRFCIKFAFSA